LRSLNLRLNKTFYFKNSFLKQKFRTPPSTYHVLFEWHLNSFFPYSSKYLNQRCWYLDTGLRPYHHWLVLATSSWWIWGVGKILENLQRTEVPELSDSWGCYRSRSWRTSNWPSRTASYRSWTGARTHWRCQPRPKTGKEMYQSQSAYKCLSFILW